MFEEGGWLYLYPLGGDSSGRCLLVLPSGLVLTLHNKGSQAREYTFSPHSWNRLHVFAEVAGVVVEVTQLVDIEYRYLFQFPLTNFKQNGLISYFLEIAL